MRTGVSSDGISPLAEKHMSVCTGGIMIAQAFILLLDGSLFYIIDKSYFRNGGNERVQEGVHESQLC